MKSTSYHEVPQRYRQFIWQHHQRLHSSSCPIMLSHVVSNCLETHPTE